MAATECTGGYTTERTSTCSSSSLVTPTSSAITPGATIVSPQSPGYGSLESGSPTSAPVACHGDSISYFEASVGMRYHWLAASAYCPSRPPFGGGCGSGSNSCKGLKAI